MAGGVAALVAAPLAAKMFGNIEALRSVGKWATLGIIPIMVIALLMMNRTVNGGSKSADPPDSGTLVVASLRNESVTFYIFGDEPTSQFLSLGGTPHEMVEANGRLYLTSTEPSQLVEILPGLPGVLRAADLPGSAHGLATDGGSVWVTVEETNELLKFDIETFTASLRWGTRTTPHAVALSGTGVPFVVTAGTDHITSYGPVPREERTDGSPESVAVVGEWVVTGNADGHSLSVFNVADLAPLGDIELDGRPIRVLAIDETRVAVSLDGANKVVIVDLVQGRVTERLDSGGRPDGLCLTPDGAYLAIVSNADDIVQVRSTENWAVAIQISTVDGPGACLWLSEAD